MKELSVLIDGRIMGTLVQNSNAFRFTYDSDLLHATNAVPLSLSMPMTANTHGDDAVRPFLWGLLPESEETLNQLGRRFSVSPRNPFALLAHLGEDLPGAIQIVPPDKIDALQKRAGATRLSPRLLADKFHELLRNPGTFQFTEDGGYFSLAGAQRKKALYLVNGVWYEPRGRTPSTHILKPPIPTLAGQAENEMFCIRLAPLLSLPAPRCWVERFEDVAVIVIERYDRIRIDGARRLAIDRPGGEVRRVHQEDCCQALKVLPHDKYQNRGGPAMQAIMRLLSGSGEPSIDRDRFMRACAYNFVIGGSDAHGKNYSLVLGAGGRFRLAPLYDIASWLPYSQVRKDRKLAMSIKGHYNFDEILPRHWREEARTCGFSPDRAIGHVRDLLARLPDAVRHLHDDCKSNGIDITALKNLVDLLLERSAKLTALYGAEPFGDGQRRLPGA